MSSNREVLMQLYERLQSDLSEPDAYDCLSEIAEVTCLIQARKESLFWADSCSLAWRTINKFASDDQSSVDATMLRAWTFAFMKPFLLILEKSRHHLAPAGSQEYLQKQKVLAAFLLHLLSLEVIRMKSVESKDYCLTILDILIKTGLNCYTVIATIRFRRLIQNKLTSLSPQSDDSLLSSSDEECMHYPNDVEVPKVIRRTIEDFGDKLQVTFFEDSMFDSDDFIAWSSAGILRLTYYAWVESKDAYKVDDIDPYTWLYVASAVVELYLEHEDLEMRKCGIEIARNVLETCPNNQLAIYQESTLIGKTDDQHQELWLSDLIQRLTSTMIQFHDERDRSFSLKALQSLLATIQLESRCKLLMKLTLSCPYANIGAVFIDKVRSDTVNVWKTLSSLPDIWLRDIPQFLSQILHSINARDLDTCTELACSCLSLLRFIKLRDQANETGIQNGVLYTQLSIELVLLQKKLKIMMEEEQSDPQSSKAVSREWINSRPYLLNAALDSSLALFQAC
uniref:Uncharacterized protein AlNc14C8G1109 n=1 Tax=Albugo laibachii Nc14 TaxID=890382 RepID=F0W236_9STRA|nr:conserved hypothetical protein [Albugo laibachii Nc14]|eukprot:CCA15115.1 conserved hypothetical protein [Albugo laibachii Nc14]